jgi:para-nitrobenzyl esterase
MACTVAAPAEPNRHERRNRAVNSLRTNVTGAVSACIAIAISFCSHQGFAMSSAAQAQQTSAPVVSTHAGRVEGRVENSLHVFKGIPFAAPPLGAARWKPPAPVSSWTGIRKAIEFGAACIQPPTPIPNIYSSDIGATSEDCLTLNIWAPATAANAPVFVWIHGGALVKGSAKETFYDGANLATRGGIIVVSINYRLGVLGYLAHPELSAESAQGVSGNYGLLDQIEALRWIKKNIAAFGGDASNVTIAGESAGGLSVMYLLAAPEARGLFAKAIAQSAYMISTPELKQAHHGEAAAEAIGTQLGVKLNAPNIAALRALDAQKLTEAAAAAGYAPFGNIDGKVLPRQLVEVFDRGEQAPVPLLAGFNSGEIRSLKFLAPPPPASAAAYEGLVHERYLDLAGEFLRLYPSADMQESVFATTRDALYGWTAERLVRKQVALGQPAFLYFFDHGYPAADTAGLHGFHASELPYVFGTADRGPPLWPKIPATPREKRLSDAMIGYWSSFARTGKPLAENEQAWPNYGAAHAYMAFADAPQPSEHLLKGMYELHEEAVCRRRDSDTQPWNWNVGMISPKLVAAKKTCP